MSKFQREIRYMVVKLKHLSESQEHALDTILSEHQIDTHTVECVVVEADWPIYEETWENVRRLAEGRASIRDELARAEAERDALEAHVDRFNALYRRATEEDAGWMTNSHVVKEYSEICRDTPETSLARRDAQQQLEGARQMYDLFDELMLRGKAFPGRAQIGTTALKLLNRLRRLAGGDA